MTDAILTPGEERHQWEHSNAPMPATHWSITFRTLSEKARQFTQRIV